MKKCKKRKKNFYRHRDFRRINLIEIHAKMDSTAVQCTDAENVGRSIVEFHEMTSILRKWCPGGSFLVKA